MVFSSFASAESSPKDTRVTGIRIMVSQRVSSSLSLGSSVDLSGNTTFISMSSKYIFSTSRILLECLTCEEPFLFSFSVLKDHSSHCDVCNVCINNGLEGRHNRRPNSGHDVCCICLEVMTYSSY